MRTAPHPHNTPAQYRQTRPNAERRRLLNAAERIGRRRAWWEAQRDAAAARVDALTLELAALEAGTPGAER